MIELPDLPAGVYEHFKRHPYLVLGYDQDRFRYIGPKAW